MTVPTSDGVAQGAAVQDGLVIAVARAAAVGHAVVLATGVWLAFLSQPTSAAAAAFTDVGAASSGGMRAVVQTVHLLAAIVGGACLLVWVGAMVWRRRPVRFAVKLGVVGLVCLATAVASGIWLPWDQLGLWSFTAGTNLSGFAASNDDSSFVLLSGQTVSIETLWRVMWVHLIFGAAALIPPVLVGFVGLVGRGSS